MIELERQALATALHLAAILADPKLAASTAAQLETVTITTKRGRRVSRALAKPGRKGPAALPIHRWWGLHHQIKSAAAELAPHGHLAPPSDVSDGRITP